MRGVVFPGQGSQQRGMGRELFSAWPKQTRSASEILGYDISTLCTDDPKQELHKTQFSQPALFVVGALAYLSHQSTADKEVDFAAGHSLGEYNALFAAGAFDFEVGVTLVKKRGELMSRATGGAMAAVLNLGIEHVRGIIADNDLDTLDIANLNTPTQIVISGPEPDIVRASALFEKAGARYARLNTSAAFHSRYMEPALPEFEKFLVGFNFRDPKFPVIANVTARPHAKGEVARLLVRQLRSPVRWNETVEYILSLSPDAELKELGHGKVLTRINSEVRRTFVPKATAHPAPQRAASVAVPPAAPAPTPTPAPTAAAGSLYQLGSAAFRRDYKVDHAYYAGPLRAGVSGAELLGRLAGAGLFGVFGAAGLPDVELEKSLSVLRSILAGKTLAVDFRTGGDEESRIRALLRHGVDAIEASDFVMVTSALVHFRLKGARREGDGTVRCLHPIICKTSRLEIAQKFLSPPPSKLVQALVAAGLLTNDEAALAPHVTMASDLCVRADGAAAEHGTPLTLLPAFLRLREELGRKSAAPLAVQSVRIGLAGGIGAPEAAAAAFLLGADFVSTSTINQCTVEAATSDAVKDLLEQAEIHDTTYAPDSAQFDSGGRTLVMKKGVFFPARANKLYELYKASASIEELKPETLRLLEEKYFGKRLEEVHAELLAGSLHDKPASEEHPKAKMSRIFREYLDRAYLCARQGDTDQRVQWNIPCSSAMGACNAWLKGTPLSAWRARHVDELAVRLLKEAAELLRQRHLVESRSEQPQGASWVASRG